VTATPTLTAGRMLAALVPLPIRKMLRWRVPLDGRLIDCETDALSGRTLNMPLTLSVGRALLLLVPNSLRTKLQWRKSMEGIVVDAGADCLIAQIGPPAPYRLLILHMEADGLVRVLVGECGRKWKWLCEKKCMTDLLENVLEEIASKFTLS
jgi:hypothetical protein